MAEDNEPGYQEVLKRLEDLHKNLQHAIDRQDAEDADHADIKRDLAAVVSDMQKNQDSIRAISGDNKHTRDELNEIRQTVEPVASWLRDAHTVGRVMRIVRAIIGWLALVVGAIALVSIAAMDAVKAAYHDFIGHLIR